MSDVARGGFFSFSVHGNGVIDRTVHPGMGINKDSNVFAIAQEMGIIDGVARPFIGNASIQVLQVCPGIEGLTPVDGAVSLRINVMFDVAIEVRVCLVIFP
jgi:hypothetical protein